MNYLKQIFKIEWIKEYLSIILLIPALIGGIWQLIELSSISTAYIRFFSVTQVVSDGILILFILTLIVLSLNVGRYGPSFMNSKTDISKQLSLGNFIKIIFKLLVFSIFSYVTYIAFIEIKNNKSILGVILLLMMFSILLTILINIILSFRDIIVNTTLVRKWKLKEEEEDELNKKRKSITRIIIIILLVPFTKYIAIPLLVLIGEYRNEFILPSNLKNLDYIDCIIEKNYSKPISYKILYLNDSYIFIESELNIDEKEVLILKFEDLLTNKCKSIEN